MKPAAFLLAAPKFVRLSGPSSAPLRATFILVVTTTACSPSGAPASAGLPGLVEQCAAAVRIAFVQDKSQSARNDVYQLRPDELRETAGLLIRCGGELAIGTVGEHSGEPLTRWPVDSPVPPPTPPDEDQTPITFALDEDAYRTDLAAWQADEDRRVRNARASFDEFLSRVAAVLAQRPDQPVTPLWTALTRADSFLAEPEVARIRSHRYLVLSSDGRNNVGTPEPLTSGAQLFISNGRRAVNALDGLDFIVVENPASAFRHIIDLEKSDADEQAR